VGGNMGNVVPSVLVAALVATASAAAASASVFGIDEVRVGAYKHDVTVFNSGTGGKESGVNIQGEIVFDSPLLLAPLLKPRPYANFSANSDGGTNFGGVGLSWQTPQARKFFGGVDFGVVIHDGVKELPADPANLDRQRLAEERAILGSRSLFRTALSAGYRVSDSIDMAVVFEHLSHGQILGSGKNEGLDNIGVRIAWRPLD
jgi:lipid A 3-O-deacylase